MKHELLYQIIKNMKTNPKLLRGVKIFLIFGFVIFISVSALGVWIGAKVVNYSYNSAKQVIDSSVFQVNELNFLNEFNKLNMNSVKCKNLATELLDISPWLEKPLMQHFESFKSACLEPNVREGGAI